MSHLGFKFGVGEIIWGLIFLVCHCPSHFLSIKFFFETGQLFIWDIVDLIIWGSEKIA